MEHRDRRARRGVSSTHFAIARDHLGDRSRAQRITSSPDETILSIDRARGHRIVAIGDVGSASSIAVLVGGAGTSVGNFDLQLQRARSLHAAGSHPPVGVSTDSSDDQPSIAVVAWLGYDAPGPVGEITHLGNIGEVGRMESAIDGGRRLRAFVSELDRRADAEITLVGHSYGSIVVARAARANPLVDRVVVLGSPGLGVDNVADLDLDPRTAFFAGGARSDPVSHVQWFGTDPSSQRFGSTPFDATGPSGDSRTIADASAAALLEGLGSAHSSYFDPGSDSLTNLGRIIRGDAPTPETATSIDRALAIRQARIDRVQAGLAVTEVVVKGFPIAELGVRGITTPLRGVEKAFSVFAGVAEAVDDQLGQVGERRGR